MQAEAYEESFIYVLAGIGESELVDDVIRLSFESAFVATVASQIRAAANEDLELEVVVDSITAVEAVAKAEGDSVNVMFTVTSQDEGMDESVGASIDASVRAPTATFMANLNSALEDSDASTLEITGVAFVEPVVDNGNVDDGGGGSGSDSKDNTAMFVVAGTGAALGVGAMLVLVTKRRNKKAATSQGPNQGLPRTTSSSEGYMMDGMHVAGIEMGQRNPTFRGRPIRADSVRTIDMANVLFGPTDDPEYATDNPQSYALPARTNSVGSTGSSSTFSFYADSETKHTAEFERKESVDSFWGIGGV